MMSNQEIIIIGDINITPLVKAQKTLSEGLAKVHNDKLYRDGVIQRFEYSFELAWKTLKRILKYKGLETNSPRDTFRESARIGLIDDPLAWFQFLDNRNETMLIYHEAIAEKIYAIIPAFNEELQIFIKQIISL